MDIIIIGGGASGMRAAFFAAKESDLHVTLLEKNEKLGKKLYITGKGRCNVTNDCEPETFLSHVMRNPKFLLRASTAFSPRDMMTLLPALGCPLKVERGNRVFPVSDKASDVTAALERALLADGVRIEKNQEVVSLILEDGACCGVRLSNGRSIRARAVIIACGGLSYPATGSTGDGYRFAMQAGHSITPCSPSLTGLITEDDWVLKLQGLTLKQVGFSLQTRGRQLDQKRMGFSSQTGGKKLYQGQGELLFTHCGVSGPLALTASSYLAGEETPFPARGQIDCKPALSRETLSARLIRDLQSAGTRQLCHCLDQLLPKRLIPVVVQLSGVDPQKRAPEITRSEREALCTVVKGIPLTITGMGGFSEAVITKGGVNVREVDPATMASKKVKGLFFAGEVLDVDALTGGYNLQIAWSTGHAAGKGAAAYCLGEKTTI